MTRANYYRILKVSPDAALDEIHRAYRLLARSQHPDVSDGATASASMSLVNEAFECLSDATNRQRYDQILNLREPPVLQRAVLEAAEMMLDRTGWRRTMLGHSDIVFERGHRRVATRLIPCLELSELERWTRSAISLLRRERVECAVLIACRILAVDKVEGRIGDLGEPLTAIDLVESRPLGMGFSDAVYEELFRPLLIR